MTVVEPGPGPHGRHQSRGKVYYTDQDSRLPSLSSLPFLIGRGGLLDCTHQPAYHQSQPYLHLIRIQGPGASARTFANLKAIYATLYYV